MIMNNTNFKQYNTAWAKLGYPKKPWYIKDCGCGEVALANCIIEMVEYANQTPKTIQPWCKQFAAPNGDGTYWSAPPTMMAHYGMTECQEHQTMNPLWKELAKGNRVAIYLMSNRLAGSKKIKWTGSKHFICSTAYRYDEKTGKHWVYVKDSNSTSDSRNGWLTYEDNLANAVFKVWSGKLITPYTPSTPYTGSLPSGTVKKGSKGADVKATQNFLNWCINAKLSVDGNFGNATDNATRKYQTQYGLKVDGIFGAQSKRKAQEIINKYAPPKEADPLQPWYDAMTTQFNWSKNQKYDFNENPTVANSKIEGTCITFPAVSLQRIGLLPSGKYFYFNPDKKTIKGNAASYVKEHTELFSLSYPNKTIATLWKEGKIKKGDIIGFGNPAYHTMVFMGMNGSTPIFNTMGHKRGLGVTYSAYASRKVNMLVHIKKIK